MKNLPRLIAPLVLLSLPAMAGEVSPTWLRVPDIIVHRSPDGVE